MTKKEKKCPKCGSENCSSGTYSDSPGYSIENRCKDCNNAEEIYLGSGDSKESKAARIEALDAKWS